MSPKPKELSSRGTSKRVDCLVASSAPSDKPQGHGKRDEQIDHPRIIGGYSDERILHMGVGETLAAVGLPEGSTGTIESA